MWWVNLVVGRMEGQLMPGRLPWSSCGEYRLLLVGQLLVVVVGFAGFAFGLVGFGGG